jgi:hypothetical protein
MQGKSTTRSETRRRTKHHEGHRHESGLRSKGFGGLRSGGRGWVAPSQQGTGGNGGRDAGEGTLRSMLERDERTGLNSGSFWMVRHLPAPCLSTPRRSASSSSDVHFCFGAPIARAAPRLSPVVSCVQTSRRRNPNLTNRFFYFPPSFFLLFVVYL